MENPIDLFLKYAFYPLCTFMATVSILSIACDFEHYIKKIKQKQNETNVNL